MATFDPVTVETVAEAWASIDGKTEQFRACKASPSLEDDGGYYEGYLSEATELMRRLLIRGFIVVPTGSLAAQLNTLNCDKP